MESPGEKLIIKLWETLVEKGIGSLLLPWQMKREGRARNEVRREELLTIAQIELEVANIRAGRKRFDLPGSVRLIPGPVVAPATAHIDDASRAEPTLEIQAVARLALSNSATDAVRGEINTSKAVIFAEDILSNDSQIPPERPIDEDWLFTWRDFAGKVSTEDLQRLWGSILAGEVKSPGSFSIRTLEFLRGLSKSDADQISQLARYVVEGCIIRSQSQHLETHGMPSPRYWKCKTWVCFPALRPSALLGSIEQRLRTSFSCHFVPTERLSSSRTMMQRRSLVWRSTF